MAFELNDILNDCKAANLRKFQVAGQNVVHLGVSGPQRDVDGGFDLASGTVDLLVADQFAESLWPEEIPPFLAEVRRVLSPAGKAVIAGYNREVAGEATRPACATELTWAEAVGVLTAAGFNIVGPKGMLLNVDLAGERLPSPVDPQEVGLDIVGRCVAGVAAPERCAGWWVAVQASPRPANLEQMAALLRYAGSATSLNNLKIAPGDEGRPGSNAAGRAFWEWSAHRSGVVSETSGGPLRAGRYRATLALQRPGKVASGGPLGAVEVVTGASSSVQARADFTADDLDQGVWTAIAVEFTLDRPTPDFRIRLAATGVCVLRADRRFSLSSLFWKSMAEDPGKCTQSVAPQVGKR